MPLMSLLVMIIQNTRLTGTYCKRKSIERPTEDRHDDRNIFFYQLVKLINSKLPEGNTAPKLRVKSPSVLKFILRAKQYFSKHYLALVYIVLQANVDL